MIPLILINTLLTTSASTPGKLVEVPQRIRPTVFVIPIVDTKNVAVSLSLLFYLYFFLQNLNLKSKSKVNGRSLLKNSNISFFSKKKSTYLTIFGLLAITCAAVGYSALLFVPKIHPTDKY
ncbi:GSCOCG00011201001-RA-CDS [Cotesia congregata]|nr:GSCOCG00011201001-RA-CDS [Cotesia congregata]